MSADYGTARPLAIIHRTYRGISRWQVTYPSRRPGGISTETNHVTHWGARRAAKHAAIRRGQDDARRAELDRLCDPVIPSD